MSSRSVVAIIPARGGSKGIPKKNLQKVGGHPLVGRTINTARQVESVSTVIVSTDDAEIADCARQYGADVIERPPNISEDGSTSEDVMVHALEQLSAKQELNSEVVLMLQCTSPFLTRQEIEGTIAAMFESNSDSAFTVVPFQHFLWSFGEKGRGVVPINHDGGLRKRRQDLDRQFVETGSVYAMRVSAFLRDKNRFCGKVAMFESSPDRSFEIDSPRELARAQNIAHHLDNVCPSRLIETRAAAIVFDFDGVFTDNTVDVHSDGRESICCSRSDGFGVERLRTLGIPMLVLSKERNVVVEARCRKLSLPCIHGVDQKEPVLREWLSNHDVDLASTIYLGNDVNDIECMRLVGCAVAPSDCHPSLLKHLDCLLSKPGGRGAIRELSDLICERVCPA